MRKEARNNFENQQFIQFSHPKKVTWATVRGGKFRGAIPGGNRNPTEKKMAAFQRGEQKLEKKGDEMKHGGRTAQRVR